MDSNPKHRNHTDTNCSPCYPLVCGAARPICFILRYLIHSTVYYSVLSHDWWMQRLYRLHRTACMPAAIKATHTRWHEFRELLLTT